MDNLDAFRAELNSAVAEAEDTKWGGHKPREALQRISDEIDGLSQLALKIGEDDTPDVKWAVSRGLWRIAREIDRI